MSEYTPTEYVVDFGDCRSSKFVELSMSLVEHNGAKLHERIVRCKDCKWWNAKYRLHSLCQYKPDGFCAWAERKQQ